MAIGMGVTNVEGQWPQGVTWSRIWDIGCHWGAINPAQGVYEALGQDDASLRSAWVAGDWSNVTAQNEGTLSSAASIAGNQVDGSPSFADPSLAESDALIEDSVASRATLRALLDETRIAPEEGS